MVPLGIAGVGHEQSATLQLALVPDACEADKWLEKQPNKLHAACSVLCDCAAALAHLHGHLPGIVHRCLQTSNPIS